jgi:hypothetical protein
MAGREAPARRRPRPIVLLNLVLWGIVVGAVAWWAIGVVLEFVPAARTTPRYDPPVLAGQMVTGGCSGGFYARRDRTIVITLSAHCSEPGMTLRDGDGLIGLLGPRAQVTPCPEGRFCAPSDFLTLALAPDRIPWGHLNEIDMGAGGYRPLAPATRPYACGDIAVGDRVEIDGRERYRTGKVIAVGPYQHATDTMFPCMVYADIEVGVGDSGGAVLVEGQPAGVVAREFGNAMGFTPLAEGLENLGLTLCTTPDCDLTPETADQPTESPPAR